MIARIKKLMVASLVLLGMATPVLAPVYVSAQSNIPGYVCRGAGGEIIEVPAQCPDETPNFNRIVATIIRYFSLIVGVVSVIMIIIGGLKYITSSGDAGNITSAKNTILYALIGLVIVALAQVIVRFVLHNIQ